MSSPPSFADGHPGAGEGIALARQVVPLVQRIAPPVQAIYVFGSAAEGRLRPDSDIDIAVLAEAPVAPDDLFALAVPCAKKLGREVDLVDLRAAPLVLQAQIVGGGRRVLLHDGPGEADKFENNVLSRYLAFVEERRPVLAEIARRRAVHAA